MEIKDLTLLVANPWVNDYVSEIQKRVPDIRIISSTLMNEYSEEIGRASCRERVFGLV